MNEKSNLTGGLAAALFATLMPSAHAQTIPITGWGTETGNQNGSPVSTDDGLGNFSLTGANLTGNDAPRALFSTLSLVNVGDNITLSGSFTFAGSGGMGNDQFRLGLYNTLAASTGTLSGGTWSSATDTGWLGYTVEVGAASGSTQLFQRNTGNIGQWFSGTGQTSMNAAATTATALAGTYAFSLSLTLASLTSYNIVDSFNQTAGGSFATGNNTTVSDNNLSFDAAGFLLNANVGNGIAPYTFNNVEVTLTPAPVPEPATLSLIGLGCGILCRMAPRRKV